MALSDLVWVIYQALKQLLLLEEMEMERTLDNVSWRGGEECVTIARSTREMEGDKYFCERKIQNSYKNEV